MKNRIWAGVAVAAFALLAIAGCSAKDSNVTSASDRIRPEPTAPAPASWSSADELATLTAIRQEPGLDAYDPTCVLDKVETHYSSGAEFDAAAQVQDAEFRATVADIASGCR